MIQRRIDSPAVGENDSSSRIYLKPFILVQANPVIGDGAVRLLMEKSARCLQTVSEKEGLPQISALPVKGFQALKELCLFPQPKLKKATSNFLSDVAKSLNTSLRERFLEICSTESGLITEFMDVVGQVVSLADLRQLEQGKAKFTERELRLLAYAVYQEPGEALERLGLGDSSIAATIEVLTEAMRKYAERYERLARFFLDAPWFNGRSTREMLKVYWGMESGLSDVSIDVAPLGFPDCYYRTSWADKTKYLFQALDRGGAEFLSRLSAEMSKAVVTSLRANMNVEIFTKRTSLRMLSWNHLTELGFFRSRPVVQIDPGVPILDLPEILTHELMHHVFQNLSKSSLFEHGDAICWTNSPCLNEGFAEFHTELCLNEVARRHPGLDYFRLARRVIHHYEDQRDPHVCGLALMQSIRGRRTPSSPQKTDTFAPTFPVKYEGLKATPGIEFCLRKNRADTEPEITLMKIPTPEFIDEILDHSAPQTIKDLLATIERCSPVGLPGSEGASFCEHDEL